MLSLTIVTVLVLCVPAAIVGVLLMERAEKKRTLRERGISKR